MLKLKKFAGMAYTISCQDLPFQQKNVNNWYAKVKKICNTTTVPSQICDGTVATF